MRMLPWFELIFLIMTICVQHCAYCTESPLPQETASDVDHERVEKLFDLLSSENFNERERAETQLKCLGAVAFQVVKRKLQLSPDPETHVRLIRVYDVLYLNTCDHPSELLANARRYIQEEKYHMASEWYAKLANILEKNVAKDGSPQIKEEAEMARTRSQNALVLFDVPAIFSVVSRYRYRNDACRSCLPKAGARHLAFFWNVASAA